MTVNELLGYIEDQIAQENINLNSDIIIQDDEGFDLEIRAVDNAFNKLVIVVELE